MAAQRELMVSGSFADGDLLVEAMLGREDLSDPFTFTLTLLSQSPDIDLPSLVGDTMTVSVALDEIQTRYFNGYVTRMALLDIFDTYARYQVTLRPWFWLMSSRVNSRIFQSQNIPNIAKALFREHGFSDFEDALSGSYPERDFVVQYRESDFAFVSRLLVHVGIYYFFRHDQGRHVLVLADSAGAHKTMTGYEEVPFHPQGTPTPSADECINHWELVHQWRPGRFASDDFDFERPKADLTTQLAARAQHKKGDLEIYDYPGGFLTLDDGEAYVRARLESLQSDVEIVHGSGDVRGLGAGNLFTLIDHPTESQNKEYLIVAAGYDAKNSPHDAGDGTPGHFDFSFSIVDSGVPFRPALATPKPRVEGPQTAIVVGQAGEEIWTDKYGRVKVQFHWDREGKNDENSSCWVRVAQVWAGAKWGAMHIPRIGQEVIVDFLEGDPDRPIITGRVYNADNMPPYDLPANQTQSGIKSRSTKGGSPSNFNEIRFEDKKGSEEMFIQAEKNQSTNVKHDRSATIGGGDSISVGGDRSVSVSGNLSVTVQGGGKGAVHSMQSVTGKHGLHASDTIEIDAPTHIKLTCGGSSLLIEPGKITLAAGGKAIVVLDANVLAQSSAGSKVVLDANALAKSSGASQVLLDANALAKSSGGSLVLLDANVLAKSSGGATVSLDSNAAVDGAKATLTGKSEAVVSGGAGTVKADGGGVETTGPIVKVNG